MQLANTFEIAEACRTLFGITDCNINSFLSSIDSTYVKKTFRNKAFMMHPDKNNDFKQAQQSENTNDFNEIMNAYEILKNYIAKRDRFLKARNYAEKFKESVKQKDPREPVKKPVVQTSRKKFINQNQSIKFNAPYKSPSSNRCMPRRSMMFGEYIYYSGRSEWNELINALIWQSRQRKKIGELAVEMGWLSFEDVKYALKFKEFKKPFGKTLIEKGLLDEMRLKILLARQKSAQPAIGSYFIEKGILSESEISLMHKEMLEHNKKFT